MEDRYLFKAKRIDNGEWVEGHYITNEKDPNHAYIGYLFGVVDGMVHDTDIVEVIPSTICQCTGLKDKNGKLIWENDVIATDCGNARVMYSNDPSPYENSFYVGFEVIFENITDNENYRHDLGYWIKFRGFEVIGNIFDNPELLESE